MNDADKMREDKGLLSANIIDIERAKEFLSYNELTGALTWIKNTNKIKAGHKAGRERPDGYINSIP